MTSTYRVDRDEALDIDTITALSRAVAADHDARLRVIGVTSSDGESGRVELLLTIHGCHSDPCVIMLNVTRSSRKAFERELRDKFGDALASHVTADRRFTARSLHSRRTCKFFTADTPLVCLCTLVAP